MRDLVGILDLHDRLVASCVGLVPDAVVEAEAEVGRAARRRLGYLAESVVVALVGGTGSGKSSLLNAIAGDDVSPSGSVRPTTSEPVAWIPANPEPGLVRLLDDLAIECRVGYDQPGRLAILDLPDTDSVVPEHRRTVERLIPLVDVVVWVVDPEKYKDDRLHRDLVQPYAAHADRFVFALNQIDRLDDESVETVIRDLEEALIDDGVANPVIVPVAADPPLGSPVGIDSLLQEMNALGSANAVVARRIVQHIKESADRLVETLGGVGGTDFLVRWTAARNETAARIAAAFERGLREASGTVVDADVRAITGFIATGSTARSIPGVAVPASTSTAEPLRSLVEETGSRLDPLSRAHLLEAAPDVDDEVVAILARLGSTTEVPLPAPPTWWSRIRLLSYLLFAVAAVGAVWVVDAARSGEMMLPGTALVLVSVVATIVLRRIVARSARERVEQAVLGQRITEMASAELERRVGRPLRAVLRERSAPGAIHTELMLSITEEK